MQGAPTKIDQIVLALRNTPTQQLWQQFLNQLSSRPIQSQSLSQSQKNNSSHLESYLRGQCLIPKQNWFRRFNQYIRITYLQKGQLLRILYRLLPVLMQKYVQINYIKIDGIEECLIDIYNNQYIRYNGAQLEKKELCSDLVVRGLYEDHLGKEMLEAHVEELDKIRDINNKSRISMKSLIFFLIYRQASTYSDQQLTDYYRCLFTYKSLYLSYCGAQEQDLKTGSLYLLQKINKVSIFKYSISEQQLQWIILTLYELCTQVKKDKFQLLAVVGVIHKKVSNQSLFRMSDVCNSLIHLLEDQYSEIFV